jgi:hypothetical protein
LEAKDGAFWLAWRYDSPAAYVPALPQLGENAEAVATTLFFNAVRWLLGRGELPPLFSLTDVAAPEPSGTRVALHTGESNTMAVAASTDPLPPFVPQPMPASDTSQWPLWLVLALSLFALERFFAAWRGEGWLRKQ